jgi:predicted enzyme related to lactoylglutathione lyase
MGKRTEHAPGTFSWVDVTTNELAGAKKFYGGLLGWQFEDNEIPGNGGVYSICKLGDDSVAAISPTTEDYPPHWNSYVTVTSADDAAAKAEELGGNLAQEPFDVMEAGRMAVLMDPTGAALCVWEPRDAIGATRVNDPGALTWNELHTPDIGKALEFYSGLFGWDTEEVDTQGGPEYITIKLGDRMNGGALNTQEGEPPNWLPYFTVESRDAAADKAKELGAQELFRSDFGENRRIAVFSDPQGAVVGVFEGDIDD